MPIIHDDYIKERDIETGDIVEVEDKETGFTFPGYFKELNKRFLEITIPDPYMGGMGLPQYQNCPFDRRRDLDIKLGD